MARTIVQNALTGGQQDFEIPFDYILQRFVKLTLIGDGNRQELVLGTDFRFIGPRTVRTNVFWGPAQGYTSIEIRRVTSASDRRVEFSDGSILTAGDLNIAQLQAIHIAEEARDSATENLSPDADGNYDARGARIYNLGDAVQPKDAVNRYTLDLAIAAALALNTGNPNNAQNISYTPNWPGQSIRSVEGRLRDAVFVSDYMTTPRDGTTSNQQDLEKALAAANAKGADLFWPDDIPFFSTSSLALIHSVYHVGRGVINANGTMFYVNPKNGQHNQLYVSPGGTGDGLAAGRPFGMIAQAITALNKRAPLTTRWSLNMTVGTYAEAITLPNYLTSCNDYLAFNWPNTGQERMEPTLYPSALDGTGQTGLTGFHTGIGNRITVNNVCMSYWYDPALTETQQVRRAFVVGAYSTAYVVNCAFIYNGIASVSVLPGGTAIVTGGIISGGRFGIDNTGGRLSLTANKNNYTVVRHCLEYGLYSKHDASSVLDNTEFLNNGNHPAAATYGAAIFAYKSNCSVDTRGVKFYRNNIAQHCRGGITSDNPGDPDIYGTGADANKRLFLCTGGGSDDIQFYESRRVMDITKRTGGGSTTANVSSLLLAAVASVRKGYFAHNDQVIRMTLMFRATGAAGIFTPTLRTPQGTIALGNFRVASGQYGEIKLTIRPTLTSVGLIVGFSCINAVQNLGSSVGQIIVNGTVDLRTVDQLVEMWGYAEAGGTASYIQGLIELIG